MKTNLILYLLIPFFLITSCATKRMQVKNLQEKNSIQFSKTIESFYVIGSSSKNESGPVLNSLQKVIASDSSEKKHLLYLGNITDSKNELNIKKDIDLQIEVIKDTAIEPYFIPGRKDWFDGDDGLEMIEEYLESKISKENSLTPNNGCPIESIEINENVQLIVLDSQWYLLDWDLYPNMNDKCEIKSRKKFLYELEGEFKKNGNKTIILAMYHPLLTNGAFGGRFSLRDHIFPLQGNIPLPVVASLIAEIRSQGAISIQDRFNKRYRELSDKISLMINQEEDLRVVVVSGHEHNLQYIEDQNIKQVISGAGSKTTPATIHDNGLFSYGKYGFASIAIKEDTSVWVNFFAAEDDPKLLYEKEIYAPIVAPILDTLPTNFPKTYNASVYELDKVDKSDFFKSFWGNHYRDVYGTKVTAKTALLDTLYGGLEVMRAGGGHQTRSLRLETKDGKEYNMRALKKSAVQFLETTAFKGTDGEKYFSNTIQEDLILDFYTAAHPYAAFAIPSIAKKAGVYYTTPELFYVPKQRALGKFNEEYGDELYMIVEKPSDEYKNRKSFGYPDDVESTDDLLKKLRADEDFTLDERAYIRARIFDMLIGDWDRHEDQWRWAVFESEDKKKVFVPIPRDRDQVFANFDGSFLNILRTFFGGVNQFGVYGEDIKDVKWFNKAGSKLDRALIKRSDKDVWLEEAKYLQEAIDLTTINEAFKQLPIEVQDQTSEEIKTSLIKRKDNLQSIVARYYDVFIKFQMLTGTDKDDYFEIERFKDGKTTINAFRIKDGEKADLLFDRTFSSAATQEIWLYGLDDKDVFKVTGDANNPILIRIIGGLDEDTFEILEGRKIKVYDRKSQENTIVERGGAHFRFTDFYESNRYDYQKQSSKGGSISAALNVSPDFGSVLEASYSKTVNRFIENPYGTKTELSLQYQFSTTGLDFSFTKEFAAIFRDFNLIVGGRVTSRDYAENFFGLGNESSNPEEAFSVNYNRAFLNYYNGKIGVERETDYGSLFKFFYEIETVEIIDNGTTFINSVAPSIFGERAYFGIPSATYEFENLSDEVFPSKGMHYSLNLGAIDNLQNSNFSGFLKSSIGFYNSLSKNKNLVLNTQAKGQVTFGKTLAFYQSPSLGSNKGLRAYRNNRFTGTHSFVGAANLIYNFEKIKTFFFPIDMSIYGGYDIGRVWLNSENSSRWHSAVGGGLMLKWTDAIQGDFSAFYGEDGTYTLFGFKLSL